MTSRSLSYIITVYFEISYKQPHRFEKRSKRINYCRAIVKCLFCVGETFQEQSDLN